MLSMREELMKKGVTSRAALNYHMDFILKTEKAIGKKLDLSRYQPTDDSVPAMMG